MAELIDVVTPPPDSGLAVCVQCGIDARRYAELRRSIQILNGVWGVVRDLAVEGDSAVIGGQHHAAGDLADDSAVA